MNLALIRFLHRLIPAILLSAVLLNTPGVALLPALALTTVVDDFGPIAIPDASPGLSCDTPLVRNINVAANVIISDLNVRLNISHIRRSDVRATLTSPAGTTVVLISGGGLGSPVIASPDDYDNYDVILDDTSLGSLYDNDNDNVAGGPDRTARPHELLGAFKGQSTAGTWVMTICDTRNAVTGTYNRTTLTFLSASANTIDGFVFIDYDQNGIRGPGDTGVAGVTVRAYNSAGAVVGSANTNAGGGYSLSVPNGTQVRVEFTNIPANLRPGAFGRDSGTTVQFVTSPLWGVDMGLASPLDYCQNNPFLVMPCYVNGDPLAGASAGTVDVLVSIPNSAYGRTDNSIEKPLAVGSQIGATWGLAYQRSTNTLFAGAIAKRHAGFGPLGGGGIYAIVVDPATGNSVSVSSFLDIDTFAGVDDGPLDDTARNLPANAATPNEDPAAWDAVGKQAIGDMDIGTNDDTLWLINLADQTLYSLFIGIPPAAPAGVSTATPITVANLPGCPVGPVANPNINVRPWAVEVYRGNVYVGVVCSAESTQNVNDLRAYILRTPEGAPGAWTLVYDFALNYPRGVVSSDAPGYPAEWRPWSPVFTTICENPCTPGLAFGNQIIYPQPILADIEFDTDGDMILGFMDRLGHQTGEVNYATSSAASTYTFYDFTTGYNPVSVSIAANALFEGTSAGDILRVCVSGGGFLLENNASCGGITTGGAGSNPAQGPGGGEYYWQDMFVQEGFPASTNLNAGTHQEVALGGLVLFPGTDEVATAVFDPFAIRSGGIVWFSNTTGRRTRGYEIFPQTDTANLFGKAAGLGDIEGFCYQTPIEIGNRIWNDTDADGVQDPGENPIAGVTVQLYQGNTLIATAVTDANGTYYFSSGPGTSTASHRYFLDALDPNETFEIRIPDAQGGSQQAALTGLTLSPADADLDLRDSDGVYVGDDAVIAVTTGNPGDNNHTYDFGFTGAYSLGNRVWLDDGAGGGVANNGIHDGGELGIPNVTVNLYRDSNGDGVPDGAILATTVTDVDGYYRFDNLPADGYVVEIASANFNTGNPLFGLSSSAVDEINPNLDVDRNDNGIGIVPGVNGIRSGTVNLGPGTPEPTGETDPITNPLPGEAPDNRSNRTVDFGFVSTYSLGNRVWFDTNNNETRDGGELGVDGVLVELYAADGSGNPTGAALATTTTAGGGYYRFDGLQAGDYVVVIPADNFIGNGSNDALVGYWSSGTSRLPNGTLTESAAPDPDTDLDNDDNGTLQIAGPFAGAVLSAAVTLGPGPSEPTGETDLSPTGQGAADDRANMTVDFGFYTMTLGDRVWADVNDDGLLAGEIGINGVDLELLSGDGTMIIATTTTAGNGNYSFTGLPAGDYIVRIAAAEFNSGGTLEGRTSSSGGGAYEPAPDPDVNTSDDDDNGTVVGVLGAGGVIQTEVITLTPGAEGTFDNATGTTNEPRVDFGVVTGAYSLGNRVWYDTNNNSTRDAGEVGVDGVIAQLFAADGAGNPTGPALAGTTTSGGGYYRFDNLPEGDYVVVLPSSNFTGGGALVGYLSSGTTISNSGVIGESAAPDPDTDLDDDDNGTRQTAGAFSGAVISGAVTLGPGASEPVGETDPLTNPLPGEAVDDHSNRTVDFGFFRLQLGNLVFEDLDNDGAFSAGDTPIAGAVVQLFSADGSTQINVGPDGILNTADDAPGGVTTGAGGTYLFSGLPQGSYILRVTPPGGYVSTIDSANQADNDDANQNIDNNDNGDGILAGQASSAVVTLTPGFLGAANNNSVTQNNGTTFDPTLDFGFVQQVDPSGFTKILLSSNQPFTTNPDVAIGEIVTYRLTITIPTGAFVNARIVDTLERGLSFTDCTAITSGTLTTSNPPGFADVCANPTVDDAGGGTTTDVGRRVTFDFGTLTNPDPPQTLTIEYRAVVLDSAGNLSGVDLDNNAVWSSDIGSVGPRTTTVTIVEPDVSIVKSSSAAVVSVGDVITLTLTIDHTGASETNAYDLVITDPLPVDLDIVPGTLDCNAGVQPADVGSCQYIAGTRTVTGTWSNFALGGGNAAITFDVTVVSIPAAGITNVANVAWTSLPGIPPSPIGNPPGQQNANIFSTERGYDPGDPIDIYGASSTLVLNAPSTGGGGQRLSAIPDTGFAPHVKTDMSGVPSETYAAYAESIWMEIPSLRVKSIIVGVPQRSGTWNVAWLGNQTGWLSGTAFPTLEGNSVVTGHVFLASGLPGPFVNVWQLKFGDQVIVHFGGQRYIYEVRENRVTNPVDSTVFRHEEETWLTLVTCKEYDEETNTYRKRVVVRAVLVKIESGR